jgi:molybdopterin-containing oxidoreductase family iron-sulfur binding subunit
MSKIPLEQRIDRPIDQTYWRSREQLAESAEFKALVEREFPNEASQLIDPVSRRNFLQLMTASIGIAGLEACRRPVEHLLPYTHTPEGVVPGVAQHFASTFSQGGKSYGVLVESHEGRPTKIEGNPEHPYSMGSTCSFGQAAVLDVYDADRSNKGPLDAPAKNGKDGAIRSWQQFEDFAVPYFKALAGKQGEGFVVISETVTSPTLGRLRDQLQKALPKAQWFAYDPLNDVSAIAGAKLAFGQAVKPKYELEAADVVASFGSDFLGHEDDGTRHARGFAKRRKPEGSMNRAYVVEATACACRIARSIRRCKRSRTSSSPIKISRRLRAFRAMSSRAAWPARRAIPSMRISLSSRRSPPTWSRTKAPRSSLSARANRPPRTRWGT